METSLSKISFKLNTEHRQLPDSMLLLPEYDAKNGTNIYLNVHIQSGLGGNIDNLTPARLAIGSYVFNMCPQDMKDFFEAKHTLCVKIPVGRNATGSLKFRLDEPLNQDPEYYAESLERVFHFGQTQFFHSLTKISNKGFREKFDGDLAPDVFNSPGVPGRTVRTLISNLEGLLMAL